MLPLLLSGAVLLGISSSERMGEQGVAFVMSAEARRGAFEAEASYSTSDKRETGDGWAARASLDYHDGPLSVGLGYTRRTTSAWHKDVLWARAGVQHGRLRLIAQAAPLSDRMEASVEARIRITLPAGVLVEPRAWVGTHTVAEELGGYAYGLTMLLGWGR